MKKNVFRTMVFTALMAVTSVQQGFALRTSDNSFEVDNVEAFKQLEDGTVGRLQLIYDTVLFVRGDEAFVRSGNFGGALMFNKTGLPIKTGQVLLGSVTGRKETLEGGMVVFVGSTETNADDYVVTDVVEIDGLQRELEFDRLIAGTEDQKVEELVGDFVAVDSVKIADVYEHEGVRHYRIKADDVIGNSCLEIVDRYGYCNGNVMPGTVCRQVSGILACVENGLCIYPLSDFAAGIVNGISDFTPGSVSTPHVITYNLLGHRKTQKKKGVYIQNGRKVLVK